MSKKIFLTLGLSTLCLSGTLSFQTAVHASQDYDYVIRVTKTDARHGEQYPRYTPVIKDGLGQLVHSTPFSVSMVSGFDFPSVLKLEGKTDSEYCKIKLETPYSVTLDNLRLSCLDVDGASTINLNDTWVSKTHSFQSKNLNVWGVSELGHGCYRVQESVMVNDDAVLQLGNSVKVLYKDINNLGWIDPQSNVTIDHQSAVTQLGNMQVSGSVTYRDKNLQRIQDWAKASTIVARSITGIVAGQRYDFHSDKNYHWTLNSPAVNAALKSHGRVTQICFYDNGKPFYEFTNFFAAPFDTRYTWRTSEQYFQAMKFDTPKTQTIFDQIQLAKSPRKAFDLAKANAKDTRPNWHEPNFAPAKRSTLKVTVMFEALNRKFEAHPQLKTLLLATDGLPIFECAPRDDCWGTGANDPNGPGTNWLGKLLEELRDLYFGRLKSAAFKTNPRAANPVDITVATYDYLKQIGRQDYHDFLCRNPIQFLSYEDFRKVHPKPVVQAAPPEQDLKITVNPNYQPSATMTGISTRIIESLSNKLTGTPKLIVDRTISYDNNNTPCKAIEISGLRTREEQRGLENFLNSPQVDINVTIQPNDLKIYVLETEFQKFLGTFLLLDQGFIRLFKQQRFSAHSTG